jgi:hypothetical protein
MNELLCTVLYRKLWVTYHIRSRVADAVDCDSPHTHQRSDKGAQKTCNRSQIPQGECER